MTTPQLDRLVQHCQRLRLHRVEAELGTLLEQAAKRDLTYSDSLDEVLGLEVRSKHQEHLAMRVSMARFPFHKTLESFDWKFQPSIDPKVIKELATGRFLADGENVLLLGPPGVGKTHLAVALGLKACELAAPADRRPGQCGPGARRLGARRVGQALRPAALARAPGR